MDEELVGIDALVSGLNLDEGEVQELRELFLVTCQSDLRQLQTALAAHNFGQAADAAHSIKGAALTLGLTAFAAVARQVELSARNESLNDAVLQTRDLERRLQRFHG